MSRAPGAWWERTMVANRWSPWIFKKTGWERKYQDWALSSPEHKAAWAVLAAIPFSLEHIGSTWAWIQGAQTDFPFRTSCGLFADAVFRGLAMLCVFFHVPGERVKGLGNVEISRLVLAARFLGCCVVISVTDGEVMRDEAKLLELLLRWFVISALAIPTFEEQTMWICLVLCLTTVLELTENGTREGSSTLRQPRSRLQLLLGAVYIAVSYWHVSTKRNRWLKVLATSPMHVDESLQGSTGSEMPAVSRHGSGLMGRTGRGGTEDDSETVQDEAWHDDYFSAEDWQEVKEEAEAEQEAMLRRGLVQRGAGATQSYQWIHTNQELGVGAHGKVRLVKHRATGELFAMKTFRLEGQEGEGAAQVAEREATLLRMLKHPNIVRFEDEVRLEGFTLLVMEWCSKGSLAWLLDSYGPLDVAAAQWVTAETLSGLRYLHVVGVAHNDLKTSNCLLAAVPGGSLAVKLVDFSTSTWKAQGQRVRIEGTVSYLPPEIADANASRRKMDIWALGVCVVEMLTGSPSVVQRQSGNPNNFLGQLLSMRSDPALPDAAPLGAPADFLRSCLRFNPAGRRTALQLAQHPFVAGATSCPLHSPAIQCALEGRPLHPAALRLSDTLLLPRLRTQCLVFFSPSSIWAWLVQLERPFLNPAVEAEFQSELSCNTLLDLALMVTAPIYCVVNLPWTYRLFHVDAPGAVLCGVFQCSMVYVHTIQTREFRFRHREALRAFQRAGMALRILSIQQLEARAVISSLPVSFALLVLVSFLLPTVAEALAWLLAMLAMVTFKSVTEIRQVAAAAAEGGGRGQGAWLQVDDNAAPWALVVSTCTLMCTAVVIRARHELRSRFRQSLRMKQAAGSRERREADSEASGGSAGSFAQLLASRASSGDSSDNCVLGDSSDTGSFRSDCSSFSRAGSSAASNPSWDDASAGSEQLSHDFLPCPDLAGPDHALRLEAEGRRCRRCRS